MDKVLLYDERQQLIETDELRHFLDACAGVTAVRSSANVVASIEGDYESPRGQAIIRLISSRRMVVVEGAPGAVLEVILAVKMASDRPLHVIDESCTFDVPLADVQTVQELCVALGGATE